MRDAAYFAQVVGGLTFAALGVLILIAGGIDTVREWKRRRN